MKKLLLITFALPCFCLGQLQNDTIKHHVKIPEYFVDSIRVDNENMFINPDNIIHINVLKKGNGQIYITYKKVAEFKKLNALALNGVLPSPSDIIIIDGKIIRNPEETMIDPSFIGNVTTTQSKQIAGNTSEFSIIQITSAQRLKEINNKIKYNRIKIRGDGTGS